MNNCGFVDGYAIPLVLFVLAATPAYVVWFRYERVGEIAHNHIWVAIILRILSRSNWDLPETRRMMKMMTLLGVIVFGFGLFISIFQCVRIH
jgi:hypothetical protein